MNGGRGRLPRVQIKYDDVVDGRTKELPFVVGVLGDFCGQPAEPLRPLKDRKFIQIDRDNFNEVLKRMSPGLRFTVDNVMAEGESALRITMKFNRMEDFEPAQVVHQVDPLRRLLVKRDK